MVSNLVLTAVFAIIRPGFGFARYFAEKKPGEEANYNAQIRRTKSVWFFSNAGANFSLTPATLCCYEVASLHYVAVDVGIMRCPKCGNQDDKVIDSRASREGSTIRRRRQCLQCNHRFTTYEDIEHEGLMVVKRDGRREEFSREKLLSGLKKACQKRPIGPKVIEDLVEKIMDEITDKYEREVPGMAIGERVMEGLREIDKVAYVRFASVYRRFEEATEFVREVKNLEANHDST
jgi:transcriptional repressor NrdR